MQKLEVYDQGKELEEVPRIPRLDVPWPEDNKTIKILQANWTMGIRIYRKAGCRAIKNTNKKNSISAKMVKTDIYTPWKKTCPFNPVYCYNL